VWNYLASIPDEASQQAKLGGAQVYRLASQVDLLSLKIYRQITVVVKRLVT
jgi:hypothetical protein